MDTAKNLSEMQKAELFKTLQNRFVKNMHRHQGLDWAKVQAKLEQAADKLCSLHEMEKTGGEPDVIGYDSKTNQYTFCDCATETPKERRNVCYDRAAWEARKKFKPGNNAEDMADAMGIELLTEAQYQALQLLDSFDTKTSSWIKTPAAIRKRGGAIFGDRRFDHVFIYHNGAESYYAGRGFRGLLMV